MLAAGTGPGAEELDGADHQRLQIQAPQRLGGPLRAAAAHALLVLRAIDLVRSRRGEGTARRDLSDRRARRASVGDAAASSRNAVVGPSLAIRS